MNDLVLLKDKNRCPQCRARRYFRTGHCHNCGMMIFARPINFKQFEEDGNDRRYWLWTSENGFIYRDHVIEGLQPLSPVVHFDEVRLNTKTAEERIAEVKRETAEKIKEQV